MICHPELKLKKLHKKMKQKQNEAAEREEEFKSNFVPPPPVKLAHFHPLPPDTPIVMCNVLVVVSRCAQRGAVSK